MAPSIFKWKFLYFISLSFLHLDCVSQRACPNLLMASKAIDLLMLDVWLVTVQMDKRMMLACHSLHVLLLISSDLTVLPSESRGRRVEKGGKKEAAATF